MFLENVTMLRIQKIKKKEKVPVFYKTAFMYIFYTEEVHPNIMMSLWVEGP